MPFRSSIFDLTVSNLSIDMLRKDKDVFGTALQEAARVTAPEGMLVFHYHPEELFHKRSDFHAGTGGTEEAYYNGDEKDNPYYASPEEIAEDLTKVGIAPTHIEKKEVTLPYSKEISDSWWEVVGQRVE
jgi:SAM-dependent methyltransferase